MARWCGFWTPCGPRDSGAWASPCTPARPSGGRPSASSRRRGRLDPGQRPGAWRERGRMRAISSGYPRCLAVCLAAAGILLGCGAPAFARHTDHASDADSLRRLAAGRLLLGTLDARRQAMSYLEQASLLAPGDHQVWLDLGRLCLEGGQRQRGRDCYERARRIAPDDFRAHAELGAAWTWEWLSSFESSALGNAERDLERAAELD